MTGEYKGKKFLTDEDLKVKVLGVWPRVDIQNQDLQLDFQIDFNRGFLGGDELVSYAQSLVYGGMSFEALEKEILADSQNQEQTLKEIIFKKTATGIGRGHSLGGLAGVVLGLNGTKMIDSGLTGFVASRSLATSSRRRETTTEEIVVPNVLFKREDLLDEYLAISRDVFNAVGYFKEKFGKLAGVETFNKVIPYNNPADLFIVLPLDSLATLQFEARQDMRNKNQFLPRELHDLANRLEALTEDAGMGIMYKQRIEVPRDTYLHYTVFKDPSNPNSALELAQAKGMSTEPLIVKCEKDFSQGFLDWLDKLRNNFRVTHTIQDPKILASMARINMQDLHSFVNEYNDAVRVKIIDTLSWRVWSEQKRHATLRQNVESVYSAVDRAYEKMSVLWPSIKEAHEKGDVSRGIDTELFEEIITMDERLKKQPELLLPYIYHTARQLMFYGKMVEEGFEKRDALYIVPKNIRLRTSETYDLINLIDLELPLRLCSTCEPERYATSWKKRDLIADAVPEISYFLHPKCNIGFCTEGKPCKHIRDVRNYDNELHKQVQQEMLRSAKEKI